MIFQAEGSKLRGTVCHSWTHAERKNSFGANLKSHRDWRKWLPPIPTTREELHFCGEWAKTSAGKRMAKRTRSWFFFVERLIWNAWLRWNSHQKLSPIVWVINLTLDVQKLFINSILALYLVHLVATKCPNKMISTSKTRGTVQFHSWIALL